MPKKDNGVSVPDAESIQGKSGLIEVETTVAGVKNKTRRKLKVRPFVTATANVGVSFGHSFEQDDGSWSKIQCSINLPCYKEEVEETFKVTAKLCERLMDEEMDRLGGADG